MSRHAWVLTPIHEEFVADAEAAVVAELLVEMANRKAHDEGMQWTGPLDWSVPIPAGRLVTYTDPDTGEAVTFRDPCAYVLATGPAVPLDQ